MILSIALYGIETAGDAGLWHHGLFIRGSDVCVEIGDKVWTLDTLMKNAWI